MDGFGIRLIDHVDLAGPQRIGAGAHIRYRNLLDLIEVGITLSPIVFKTFEIDLDTRLIAFEHKRTGTFTTQIILVAVRHHLQVIITHQRREIGVGATQLKRHGGRVRGQDFFYLVDDGLRRRGRVLTDLMRDGPLDIFRGQSFAIVEFDPVAKTECPLRGIFTRRPLLSQAWLWGVLMVGLDQGVTHGELQIAGEVGAAVRG